MSPRIPEAAQELIVRHIHSVAQLEVLLYARERPGETIAPSHVSRDQKIGEDMAESLLSDLDERGFLERNEEGFLYGPPPRLAAQVDSLAGAYSSFRVTIINLIFSKPGEGVQSFADAFKLRRDDD